MNILIFIVVIVALIVVHEFGHFIAAKLSGMRVDEFGLGYPPRALTIGKWGETEYTLNWLPFGGFVKIYGEDGIQEQQAGAAGSKAFSARPRILQAFVLVAGIAMNLLFAYALITSALVMGTPRALSESELAVARDTELMVASILPGTPASVAGLLPGDAIVSAKDAKGEWRPSTPLGTGTTDPKSFSAFITASGGSTVTLDVKRNGEEKSVTVTPKEGVATNDPFRYALGVEVAAVGVVPLSLGAAIQEGAALTWGATKLTAVGLWHFFYGVFTLSADLSQVAGPIGIAGAVGSASSQGVGNLLSLIAIISINLALINLIPVPALDGGRLLFVIIESIIRRPIKASIAHAINSIGFVFLILLMLVVTAHDIFKIIG
ncbi:site-2 protease family protein [Candidatus Kaiserbacteria bacterium]|nr:site-2 protease family protein [Candidatus Kaiserbacteria bacterium]